MMYTAHTDLAFNLVLCVGIFALGYLRYAHSKNVMSLYIGAAFGLFGTTYLVELLGAAEQFQTVVTVARLVGYLIILAALYSYLGVKTPKSSSGKKKR